MKDLTKGKPFNVILAFAIPVFISYILQLCYSLADTRIVNTFIGNDALTAVGATSSLSGMIIGFLNGLTNGFAVIVANFFGAKDYKNMKRSVAASFVLGLAVSVTLTLVCLVGLKLILHLLNVPETVFRLAYNYIFIIFLGMTVSMIFNLSSALLRALGDTVTPMIFLAVSVLFNIGGDIFCIKVLNLGVIGAALATVAAQVIASASCMVYMLKRYELLRISRADFDFDSHMVWKILSCGSSMGFMSCLVNIGSVSLQSGINGLGDDYIIAQTGARKLSEVYMMMFPVLGQTMATYCSQNYGAGRFDRIRDGLKKAILIGTVWCALVALSAYTMAPLLIHLVCGQISETSLKAATLYLRIDTVLYEVTLFICVFRNALQGLGDHITPVVSSSIECIGKILIVALLVPRLRYMGVILAEPIVWCFMVIPLVIQMNRHPAIRRRTTKSACVR